MTNVMLSPGTWKEQFLEAIRIGECKILLKSHEGVLFIKKILDEKEDRPGLSVYVLHFLSLPWKVLSAITPPPGMFVCWLVSHLADCKYQIFMTSLKFYSHLCPKIENIVKIWSILLMQRSKTNNVHDLKLQDGFTVGHVL